MKTNNAPVILVLIFILVLLFGSFYLLLTDTSNITNTHHSAIHDELNYKNDTFTFAWMSDTQYYSESHPEIFNIDVNYILKNKARSNIKYVIHTGDIVDDMHKSSQWINANNSLTLFNDSNMPYGVLAVYDVLADYQYGEDGGNGYIRLIKFDPLNDSIDFMTYSPKLDDYNFYNNNELERDEYGYKDEFSLPFDLN